MGVLMKGVQCELWYLTVTLIMKEKKYNIKTVSHKDMNVRNSMVKFVDNLPFRYFIAPQKEQ